MPRSFILPDTQQPDYTPTGNVTSTSTFNGISSPAIRGRTENWLACSATSPLSALVRGDTTTTAYGVDALITSLIQTCSGTPMQYTSVRVPMLPVSPICTAQAIPSIFCGKCPTYGTTALDCTGWTSSTTTIKGRPAMHYIATGCKNNSITTAGIAQNLQTLAEVSEDHIPTAAVSVADFPAPVVVVADFACACLAVVSEPSSAQFAAAEGCPDRPALGVHERPIPPERHVL